ncbi:ABC transporter [Altererythrobacter soli]|uniref:ABC transporter n=1 Tax=Croceibacterium soli TaxID=1739690 RepID=A0A6I4UT86_9SPHN|nr:Gldg family protein [Croceibacterium soli]MXP41686.1 ABC transporter [Croceibacterium soli]
MPSLHKAIKAALATALLFLGPPAVAQVEPQTQAQAQQPRAPLGLMGTIPIYWGEAEQFGDLIGGAAEAHWARAELEREYELRPIAYLDEAALAGLDRLLLAQPRPLSGEENVALDAWVRGGGQLLLFADPMMTGHSEFGLGDRRRPQDVVLLSPILNHWGLALQFADDQPLGTRVARDGDLAVPVNLPGQFTLAGDEGCALSAEGLLARCALGRGHATILADAAMLDLHEPSPLAGPALGRLAQLAFAGSGEIAGE